jgi:hypothetical protein
MTASITSAPPIESRRSTRVPGPPAGGSTPKGPARRVRVPLLMGALAAMLLATVLVLYGLSSAAHRTQVLRVIRDVAPGETITADALAPVGVAVDGAHSLVPAAASGDVVGKVAAKALVPGDLLSRSDAVDAPLPVEGERRVGAVLAPGRYPLDLRRGDLALATASDGEATSTAVRVLDLRAIEEGIELVLAVPADAAANIAQLSAQGRLAIVGESRP